MLSTIQSLGILGIDPYPVTVEVNVARAWRDEARRSLTTSGGPDGPHLPRLLGQAGGIMDKTLPIEGSNVMLVNPKTGKGDRVGYKVVDGKKVRVFKSDGAVVGAKA